MNTRPDLLLSYMKTRAAFVSKLSLVLIFINISARASIAPISGMYQVGEGRLSFWGMEIYQVVYYADSLFSPREPSYALEIEYFKDISLARILDSTQKEWRRQRVPKQDRERWLEQLSSIWSDVKKGDKIICYVLKQGSSSFYLNNTFIGQISDPNFSSVFFDIWLASDARDKRLRQSLLERSLEYDRGESK